LNCGGFSNPHLAQRLFSGVAQLPQNFKPVGFSNSHFGQRIGSPPFPWTDAEYRPNTGQRKQAREGFNWQKGRAAKSLTVTCQPYASRSGRQKLRSLSPVTLLSANDSGGRDLLVQSWVADHELFVLNSDPHDSDLRPRHHQLSDP